MTIRAKSEDLPRLIAETKGEEYVEFRGEITLIESKARFQPHTDGNQALQLLCEIITYIDIEPTFLAYCPKKLFYHPADVMNYAHNGTPESICQAICLAFLASKGVHVELIEE